MAAPTSEPQPGAGSSRNSSSVILGSSELVQSLSGLQKAIDALTSQERQAAYAANPSDPHTARFTGSSSAQKQFNDFRTARTKQNETAQNKRQADKDSQSQSQAAYGNNMRSLVGQNSVGFPKMQLQGNQGYTGGVASQPVSPVALSGGSPGQQGFMAQRSTPPLNLNQVAAAANGGSVGGRNAGARSGNNGPNIPGAAFGSSGNGGLGSFISANKGAIGAGAIAGVAQAAGNALNNYSTRMLNTNYDQFGNLYVQKNGGYSGGTYGQASSSGINTMRPYVNVATSAGDLIAGSSQILANSPMANYGTNMSNAGTSAYLTPGMGMAQSAANQQQEGTNQANVSAMMMFGQGTKTQGGGEVSEVQLANMALNATRGGQGMTGMTPAKMQAMLAQGGSLRTNLNTYAASAGLSSSAVDSLSNILTAQEAYQNKYGNTTDFQSTVTAASQGDKTAQAKLQGTGIGESVQQSIQTRQGAQMNRDMNSQSSYIDEVKKTNALLTTMSSDLTAIMKASGADKFLGGIGGINAATGGLGGRLLTTAGYAAAGFAMGGPVGAAVGGAIGFISGGAAAPVKSASSTQSKPTAAASSTTSAAATTAENYAMAQNGKPYVEGGIGPDVFDCSGLMQSAYKAAGVSIPRTSSQQSLFGLSVPTNQIGPGDLIFPKGYDGMNSAPPGLPGHVVMALSGGPNIKTIEAGTPATGVYIGSMNVDQVEVARRVTGGVGTLAPNMNTNSTTGATTTNTSSAASSPQGTATKASGMNEVDVLASVLGSASFQTAGSVPQSQQSSPSASVNGTANALPGYSSGSYNISGDQVAQLHDGEMVLDAKRASSLRNALMADIPTQTQAGGNSAALHFASGAITINVNGGTTSSNMTSAGKQVVDAIAGDSRIQQIGAGL